MKDKGLASIEKKCWVKSLKEQIQTGRQTTMVYDAGHYGHNFKKERYTGKRLFLVRWLRPQNRLPIEDIQFLPILRGFQNLTG